MESRAVTLLMKALPDQVKEELIATKSLDVFSLVCRLMLLYQPGGVAERSSILKNLEQPQEAATIQAAVQGIRRWLRWKRRAEEIGVSLPDPSVLSRGLHRLTKKVLEGNKDLSFNISLARSTLQVDTVPNYGTISTYCEHLLSELEQLVHTEKKMVKAPDYDGKIKKFEGVGQASGGGGGKGWEGRSPKKGMCEKGSPAGTTSRMLDVGEGDNVRSATRLRTRRTGAMSVERWIITARTVQGSSRTKRVATGPRTRPARLPR